MSYFVSIDSVQGPFNTIPEAEFAAEEALKQLLQPDHPFTGLHRQARVLEQVRTVDMPTSYFKPKKSV